MNIFLGGGRCSSRKKFAYSVRQSDYLSLKAIGDHPVKNDGSTCCWNLIYKCHENSLWGLTYTPPVMGSSLPLEKASPFLQALVFSKVLLVVSRTQSPLLTSSFLQHPQLSPANPTFVLQLIFLVLLGSKGKNCSRRPGEAEGVGRLAKEEDRFLLGCENSGADN